MVLRLLILLAIGLFPRLHTSFRYTNRWKQVCSRLRGIKKESYSSESVPFGYSKQLQIEKGRTQVIHGSNAIEHAVNLITEQSSNERRRVLVLTGWNIARVDPLLWELEPRGFTLFVESLSSDDMPSPIDVGHIVNSVLINSIDIVICMGSGGVMDAAKVAVSLLTSHYALHPPNIAWLAQMQSIYSQDEIDISNKDILLVMIPVAPCSGAETSSFSAISPSPVDTRTIHSIPSPSLRFKDYIYCVVPHIAVVQPNLLYRLPMTLLHDRIISLFGAAVEIVLTASDFLQSYLAYDSLQKLSPLLLKSIQSVETRLELWRLNASDYEDHTMNDLDPNHYSQYSKRYGNNFTEADIEKISLIGAALSSNSIENVSTLHFMADTLSASTNSHAKHSYIRAQIFSNFLVELHHSAFDGGVDDPDKSSLRTKLGNIMDALTSTTGCNISSAAALANIIRKSYSDLELIQDNSTEPHRTMPILQSLPSESQTELYNRLRHENSRALGLALKPASLERVLLGNDSRFVCDSSMSLSPEGSGQELSATTPVNFPSDELDVNDILIANIIDDDSEVALRSLEKFRRRMGELTSAEPLLEFPLDDLNDDIF